MGLYGRWKTSHTSRYQDTPEITKCVAQEINNKHFLKFSPAEPSCERTFLVKFKFGVGVLFT